MTALKTPARATLAIVVLLGITIGTTILLRERTLTRTITVIDKGTESPVAHKLFVFTEDAPFAPLIKGAEPNSTLLNERGEAVFNFKLHAGWARIDLDSSNSYGTSLTPLDIKHGGTFHLFGPPASSPRADRQAPAYILKIGNP